MARQRIYILYTGGTIGMGRSPSGYAPLPGLSGLVADMLARSSLADTLDYTLDEYPTPLDSANARPRDWLRIARDIAARYAEYDGFIVMHGTDTMAYTASALSFLLQGLAKPVIVTGSQIPLRELRNDAQNNLITALILAAQYPVPEVCLYFNGRLLRGNRATKLKADSLDAFDSPNFPRLGDVGIHISLRRELLLPAATPHFQLPDAYADDGRVAVLKLFPGLSAGLLMRLLEPPLQGLVLEAYGVGNAPDQDSDLLAALRAASERGLTTVVVSQCLEGRVDLSSYAAGAALAATGAVSGYDLTTEAALTKLHHLTALGLSPAAIRTALGRSLCGECTISQR